MYKKYYGVEKDGKFAAWDDDTASFVWADMISDATLSTGPWGVEESAETLGGKPVMIELIVTPLVEAKPWTDEKLELHLLYGHGLAHVFSPKADNAARHRALHATGDTTHVHHKEKQ